MFVVRFLDGSYYYGYKTCGNQLRKAMIYNSEKKCREAAKDNLSILKKDGYEIVVIEIREIGVLK